MNFLALILRANFWQMSKVSMMRFMLPIRTLYYVLIPLKSKS